MQLKIKVGQHRPARETFRWRAYDDPTLNAGLLVAL